MIAIVEAYRASLLKDSRNIFKNISSGIIVGLVALPLAMAFAIASGATPQSGLYTSIVAGICIALFGGSRVQIAGPTGAFIVVLAGITAQYGFSGLQIATLMAGSMLVLMGLLKLGSVIKYIPESVVIGFTSGIAFIIWVGQWKYFFGVQAATSHLPFYVQLWHLLKAVMHPDIPTTLLGLLSLALLLAGNRWVKKIPAPLIAIVVATALQAFFKFPTVATIGSVFGELPRTFPMPHAISVSMDEIQTLMLPAFTIAMLGAIESLLSATVADGMLKTHHDSNQELIGQGIGNILAPIFGGFAATGAIARTATNIRNGGNSPIAGVVHSLTLILIIILFAPLATNIPLCCLAAILFVVAYNMSDWRRFMRLTRQAPYYDVVVLWLTFVITIFVNLVVAVSIGVILASLLFVRRMSQSFDLKRIETHHDGGVVRHQICREGKTIEFAIEGPMFFG
ncbi:MAG: sodium-independent anion transporter, partial [Gammaproteobacteria bacterium]|nr:sodium-independent anion transporter [Gammaproteobacteria bacterium]